MSDDVPSTTIDQNHPEYHLWLKIEKNISTMIQPRKFSDVESKFISALCDIWTDERQRGRAPLKRFFDGMVVSKGTINSALSDYPEISEECKKTLEYVLNEKIVRAGETIDSSNLNDDIGLENIIKGIFKNWYPPVTRFEKARIVGARALQISYGAPVLVDYPNDMLDPIDIALMEYEEGLIPITVVGSGTNSGPVAPQH